MNFIKVDAMGGGVPTLPYEQSWDLEPFNAPF